MRLRSVSQPFDDPDYIFELKHDGWRALAYVEDGACKLVSRNLKGLRFDLLQKALGGLPVRNAILDGELVVLDQNGVSRFNSLLTTKGRDAAVFYAFDLVWMDGEDLRKKPLIERKARLKELVRGAQRILYAQHVEGCGKNFFEEICQRDLEGAVGKKRNSVYREDRPDWIKVKNKIYSQGEGRHELLTKRKR